ncbi:helix-turn-helix transcriptional regulator [Hephaestia sp. GCM10023244]|uniref:helix-turn-helix transcriptional regulator n=1 Tax=unclassified Hephaestia TaxID=2631281 RepID=UPI002077777A|nr:AraC family transcriptional regulator [Hephaestia sp. MAHUQ-44]MCM8731055.1 AraC family transcriptional regulator [Hephaestia sp. MAHUQ-44]
MSRGWIPAKGFQRIDTSVVPANQRFAFWSAVHDGLDMSLIDPSQTDYRASLLTATSDEGIRFGHSVSANTRARFGGCHSLDLVLVSLTTAGVVDIRHGHDSATRITPDSGLIMLDHKRAAVTATGTSDHAHAYLSLPRRLVVEAAGGDPIAGGGAIRRLATARLAPFLEAHLRLLMTRSEALSADDVAVALDVGAQLALACIREVHGISIEVDHNAAHGALFAAARHYIDLRYADPDLTATTIATALGCSRAHLYRVFAANGSSIGQLVRDIRLEKACTMLVGRHWAIEQIARLSGYGGAASFTRAFRAHFGISPGEWRATANETRGQRIGDDTQPALM